MVAQIVVVLRDAAALDALATAIAANGHAVQAFTDPMAALAAIEQPESADILITGLRFSSAKPNGLALAMMGRMKRHSLELIFICDPADAHYVADVGRCLPPSVDPAAVSVLVNELASQFSYDSTTLCHERVSALKRD